MIVWTQLWTQSHSSPAFTSVNVRTCMQCTCQLYHNKYKVLLSIVIWIGSTHIQRWVTEPGLQSGSECLHKLDWDPRPRQAFSNNSNLQYILHTTSRWVASFPGPPSFLSLAVRESLSIFHLCVGRAWERGYLLRATLYYKQKLYKWLFNTSTRNTSCKDFLQFCILSWKYHARCEMLHIYPERVPCNTSSKDTKPFNAVVLETNTGVLCTWQICWGPCSKVLLTLQVILFIYCCILADIYYSSTW